MKVRNLVSTEEILQKDTGLKVIFFVDSRFSADSHFSYIKTYCQKSGFEFFSKNIWLVVKVRFPALR